LGVRAPPAAAPPRASARSRPAPAAASPAPARTGPSRGRRAERPWAPVGPVASAAAGEEECRSGGCPPTRRPPGRGRRRHCRPSPACACTWRAVAERPELKKPAGCPPCACASSSCVFFASCLPGRSPRAALLWPLQVPSAAVVADFRQTPRGRRAYPLGVAGVPYILIALLFGIATGFVGRGKGSSFFIWFLIGTVLPF